MTTHRRVEFQVWDGTKWTTTRVVDGIETAAYEFTRSTKAKHRHAIAEGLAAGKTVGAESRYNYAMMRCFLQPLPTDCEVAS